MDTSRVSPGELVAGVSGLLLFVFLFLDWIGPFNAWEVFDFMDIVLAVIGLGTALLVGARMAGKDVGVPGGSALLLAVAGISAFWIVVSFLIEGDERKIGIWLALLATIGLTYGGVNAGRGRVGRSATEPA